MARKVFITSDMSVDERLIEVAEKDPQAALLWPWILTAFDDWGRSNADPRRLKVSAFPAIDCVTVDLIKTALNLFAEVGLIMLYEHQGKRYMAIPAEKWFKYQTHIRSEKRTQDRSHCPTPPQQGEANCTQLREDACNSAQERENERICTPSPSPSPSPSSTCTCAPSDAQDENGNLGESVEAEQVTATPDGDKLSEKSGPRSPFKSKRQEQLFDEFWAKYPKKRSKGQAERAWAKITLDDALFAQIIEGLERAKRSRDWIKESGQYIPYPATWLNAKGWEDDYQEVRTSGKHRAEPSEPGRDFSDLYL